MSDKKLSNYEIGRKIATLVDASRFYIADAKYLLWADLALNMFSKSRKFLEQFFSSKGADTASAAVVTLDGKGNLYDITGTDDFLRLDATGYSDGSEFIFQFDSIVKITHGLSSFEESRGFKLPNDVDYITTAGERIEFQFDDGFFHFLNSNKYIDPFPVVEVAHNSSGTLSVSSLNAVTLVTVTADIDEIVVTDIVVGVPFRVILIMSGTHAIAVNPAVSINSSMDATDNSAALDGTDTVVNRIDFDTLNATSGSERIEFTNETLGV